MKIFRSVSDMSKVQIIIKVIRILKYWKYNVFVDSNQSEIFCPFLVMSKKKVSYYTF